MATIAKGHVVNCAPFAHKSQCMRVQRPSECALRMRFEFARSCVRLPSRSRMRSIVVCMRFVRAKRKCTQHSRRRESGCACVRMRLQFACAFVRMHSHVRMPQPSSSGVMHAKPRGVHGTGQARHDGTSTPPHKKCEHGNARYGLCVQVLHLAGLTSTLCSVDTSGARGRLRHISKAPVSADTLYCRKCFRRFPGG